MTALKYSLFIQQVAVCDLKVVIAANWSRRNTRPLLLTTINRNLKRIKSEGDSDERDDVVQNKDSINQISALRPPTHTERASAKLPRI
jgi:hypothetical protein